MIEASDIARLAAAGHKPYGHISSLPAGSAEEHYRCYLESRLEDESCTAFPGSNGVVLLCDLPWDSERLGVRSGRIEVHGDTSLGEALSAAKDRGYRFLWSKCPSRNPIQAHALEDAGFRLMDCEMVLVYGGGGAAENEGRFRIEAMQAKPIPELACIGGVFSQSRFHADPNIANEAADGLWRESVINALAGRADEVFVAFDGDNPVGMVSCMDDALSADVFGKPVRTFFHVGVAPGQQGKGAGWQMLAAAIKGSSAKAAALRVETQSANRAALALYQGCGFQVAASYYSFHYWI